MSAAVVTITCPKCGGDVKGVKPSGEAQKIPCIYCGTDLHVPTIGAVRRKEKSRNKEPERAQVEAPPNQVPARSDANTRGQVIVGVTIFIAFVVVIMISVNKSSDDPLADFHRREAAQKKCEDECRESCENAPRPSSPSSTQYNNAEVEHSTPKIDQIVCIATCSQTQKCWER